jgi:hypothetical protein
MADVLTMILKSCRLVKVEEAARVEAVTFTWVMGDLDAKEAAKLGPAVR